MEVKPGYKQTGAGVIPEEWAVQHLGNVASIITGRKDVNEGNPTGEYPFFTCSRSHTFSDRYSFDMEAILIAGNGEVGNLHHYIGRFEAYQRTYVVHKFSLPVRYIWHQLDYRLAESLGLGKIGTSIPYIKKENLTEFTFPIPPTEPEQRAIAGALSDVDALIGALDRLIAKKRDLKQAAMQQLLTGQTRLPGFSGEWEVTRLQAICSMKSGEGITGADIDAFSKYPCYGGNGLRGFTSRFTHNGAHALIGRQGALCGNVVGVEGTFFASEHAVVVTALSTTDIQWLTYVLGDMRLNQYSESSAQPGLSVGKVLSLDIALPPTKAEQRAIAQVLSEMDAELAALEQRRDKTRALKQGMMQELLTGRIRLV